MTLLIYKYLTISILSYLINYLFYLFYYYYLVLMYYLF